MEELYRLHPIFEFYLTAYFGFIIAPDFISKFLIQRIVRYFEVGRNTVINQLDKLIEQITSREVKYNSESDEFKCHQAGKLVLKQLSNLKDIKEDIENLKNRIINTKTKDPVDEITFYISNLFDNIFPFAAFYAASILLLNGCKWGVNHESTSLYCLSVFNFICSIYFIFLFVKNYVPFFNKLRARIEYNFIYSILAIILINIISFPVIYYSGFNRGFSLQYPGRFTIVTTIIISMAPLAIFGILINIRMKNYFQENFRGEIEESKQKTNAAVSDYDQFCLEWKQNFKDMESVK